MSATALASIAIGRSRFVIAPALLAVALGCGHTSTTPSTANVVSLAIKGPSQLALDQIAGYAAIATYADGSMQDVTGFAIWTVPSTGAFGSQGPAWAVKGRATGFGVIR